MENEQRRQFLKLAALGGVAIVFGKMLSGIVDFFQENGQTTYFKNFKITESKAHLGVYEKDGTEILIIDKEQ